MGNRAYVIFEDAESKRFSPIVYLHWHGGPESVYQFLDELDRRQVRRDEDYASARFAQIVGEFFMPEQLSLGLMSGPTSAEDLWEWAHEENGLYVVCRELPVKRRVRRLFKHGNDDDAGKGRTGKELSPRLVEKERKEAYELMKTSRQHDGIATYLRASFGLLAALKSGSLDQISRSHCRSGGVHPSERG